MRGPYSVMQNINQRTEVQRAALEEKRKYALRQYVSCATIYRYCVQRAYMCHVNGHSHSRVGDSLLFRNWFGMLTQNLRW